MRDGDWLMVGEMQASNKRVLFHWRDGWLRLKLRTSTPGGRESANPTQLSIHLDAEAREEFQRLFIEAERRAGESR